MQFLGGCALSHFTNESCSGTSFPSEKSLSVGSMATEFGFALGGFAGVHF